MNRSISFVFSPVGMTAAIISGALALAITFAEQAGIILIVSRFNAGRKITAYQALLQMLKYLRVDNIITVYSAKLVVLINERAALNDVEKFLLVAADMLKR